MNERKLKIIRKRTPQARTCQEFLGSNGYRGTDTWYTIGMRGSGSNTMVAENLGTIPPNTSYMIAEVAGKRYEARLASTENSSALIRLTKGMAVRTGTQ